MSNPLNTAFIIGTGRCGTTMLGQMLNSHSAICVPPEIQLIFECDGNGNRLTEEFVNKGSNGFDAKEISSIIERCCPYKLEKFFDYKSYCQSIDLSNLTPSNFLFDFYSAIASSFKKSWLIEQTPWYGQRIDLLVKYFPDAKFIHIVRDGRDVALSFSRTLWWDKSVHLNLGRWAREIKKISMDAAIHLDESSYHAVKYEDIVTNPEYELRRICDFLGVNFEASMCDSSKFISYDSYAKFEIEGVSSTAYRDWKKEASSAVFSENVHAWLREKQLFSCEFTDEINQELHKFNYSTSVEMKMKPSPCYFDLKNLNIALEEKVVIRNERIANLTAEVGDRNERIANLTAEVGDRNERIANLTAEVGDRNERIANLTAEVGDCNERIANLTAEVGDCNERIANLTAEVGDRNASIAEIHKSIGWCITSPLRFIGRFFKNK